MRNDSKKTKGLIRHFVLMAIFCGLLLPLSASAQKSVVKGTVKDSDGELLMGAGVVVKGTSLGTVTDADGNILTNSKVMVTLNGKKAYATTDSEGVYQFTGYGQEGQNTFTVGYYGTNNYNAYTSSETKLFLVVALPVL